MGFISPPANGKTFLKGLSWECYRPLIWEVDRCNNLSYDGHSPDAQSTNIGNHGPHQVVLKCFLFSTTTNRNKIKTYVFAIAHRDFFVNTWLIANKVYEYNCFVFNCVRLAIRSSYIKIISDYLTSIEKQSGIIFKPEKWIAIVFEAVPVHWLMAQNDNKTIK